MPTFGLFAAIAVIVCAALVALALIGTGELLLAIREIALNTRKEENKNQYRSIKSIAILYNFAGWLILSVGILIGMFSIITTMK